MAGSSSPKTPNSLHVFSMKAPSSSSSSSSSSLSSMKLKTLFRTFIFSHMYRIARAFAKAKSVLLKLLGDIHFIPLVEFPLKKNKNNKQKKLFFGSFRLHYNWCSSHVMPLGQESYSSSHVYYDSCWNSVIPTSLDYHDQLMQESDELSRYLQWLEEKDNQESSCNEIDKLADLFIANCYEKFRLEKQESYRRFEEMMARSV